MTNQNKNRNRNKKKGNKGKIVSLSYSTKKTIAPEQTIEKKSFGSQSKIPVIPFFSHFNDFAIQLAMLSEVVPEHDACIKAKKRWSTKSGFTVVNNDPSMLINNRTTEVKEITPEQLDDVNDFVREINLDGESLKDIVKKVICDSETIGNSYIELSRGEIAGERFFHVNHREGTTGLLIRRDGVVTVGFCASWKDTEGSNKKNAPVVELPLYKGKRTEWLTDENGVERCVLHLKQYRTGRFFYGLPDSIASFIAQKIGFEISRHNLDRLETDFFPRLFFEFFNVDGMTEQEQEEHLRAMIDTFTNKNPDDKFSIFAQYNETSDSQTKVHKLELDKTGEFIEYKRENRQDILTAHGVHPIVAGIQTPGSLGSSKEISEVFELFNSTVIEPIQDELVERLLTPIMRESSEFLQSFEGLFLKMNTTMPVSFMGEIDVNKVLTKNEGREIIGVGKMKTETSDGEVIDDPRGNLIIDQEIL